LPAKSAINLNVFVVERDRAAEFQTKSVSPFIDTSFGPKTKVCPPLIEK